MTHADYIESIKSSILKLGKEKVLEFIFSKLVFLSYGPLGILTSMIVDKVLTIFINEAETRLFFAYIDTRTNSQGLDFSDKAIANFKAQQNGTEDEKKIAEKALMDSFRNFASLMR